MFATLRPAIVLFLLMTLLTGVVYPAIVTGIARLAFRSQAEGSIVSLDGKEIGSALIAQPFTDPKYFWPRPSAANYDATASAGSNLSPTNPALADAIKGRIDALRAAAELAAPKSDAVNTSPVPIDLVTASASGLDPHLSLAAAKFQMARIAAARGVSADTIQRLVDNATEPALLGVLGDAKVNVLRLNLLLDHPSQSAAVTSTNSAIGWRSRGFMPD